MRITYLTTSAELGGAETSLLEILASLRAAEPAWRLSLVAPADGPAVDRARALGVDARVLAFPEALARLGEGTAAGGAGAVRLGRAAVAAAAHARRLRRALERERPDIVHANGFKAHVLGSLATPPGAALVWHVHDYVGGRPWTRRALRRGVSRVSAIITNSECVARDVVESLGPSAAPSVVYNAVDLTRFTPDGARLDLDAAANLPAAPAGTVRVGLVGTLGRWKGHDVFLDALARLPRSLPVRGFIVGGALYRTGNSQLTQAELAARGEALGLSGRVGFTGITPDAAAAMRALDIVIHASTAPEPFGMVIAEAMACGRAVVVSLAGGAAEIVRDGVDAVGHPPGDAAALADRIGTLAANPDLRARLGRAARASAEARFDRARLARQLVPLYQRLARAG